MTWMFQPKNDICVGCEERGDTRHISIKSERHYIVWDGKEGVYRRECAACYDLRKTVPYNRRKSSDPIVSPIGDPREKEAEKEEEIKV